MGGGWTQKLEQNKFQKDLQSVRVGAFSLAFVLTAKKKK